MFLLTWQSVVEGRRGPLNARGGELGCSGRGIVRVFQMRSMMVLCSELEAGALSGAARAASGSMRNHHPLRGQTEPCEAPGLTERSLQHNRRVLCSPAWRVVPPSRKSPSSQCELLSPVPLRTVPGSSRVTVFAMEPSCLWQLLQSNDDIACCFCSLPEILVLVLPGVLRSH